MVTHQRKASLFGVFLVFILMAKLSLSFSADEQDAPLLIEDTIKVSAEGLLEIAEKTPDILLIDSRIKADRKQGYIEGSISLPDIDTNCKSLAKIIPKKNNAVLFYCNGVKCGRSVTASKIALKCGYTTVYWFRGGYAEWQAKKYPSIKD